MDATDANLAGLATELRSADERIEGKLDEVAADLKAQLDGHTDELDNLAMQLEAQEDACWPSARRGPRRCGRVPEAAPTRWPPRRRRRTTETASVASDLVRVDEAQKAALNDLRFKIDHNFKAIEQTRTITVTETAAAAMAASPLPRFGAGGGGDGGARPPLGGSRRPGARGGGAALARERRGRNSCSGDSTRSESEHLQNSSARGEARSNADASLEATSLSRTM